MVRAVQPSVLLRDNSVIHNADSSRSAEHVKPVEMAEESRGSVGRGAEAACSTSSQLSHAAWMRSLRTEAIYADYMDDTPWAGAEEWPRVVESGKHAHQSGKWAG